MRRFLFLVGCFFIMTFGLCTHVSAASDSAYIPAKTNGAVFLTSNSNSAYISVRTIQWSYDRSDCYYVVQIPASAVSEGAYFTVDTSSFSSSFNATFFWSNSDLLNSAFWNSSYNNLGQGAKDMSLLASGCDLLVGDLGSSIASSSFSYSPGELHIFDPGDTVYSTGYYYITGVLANSADLSSFIVEVVEESEPEPTLTPTPTQEPTPSPSFEPIFPEGNIDSVSAELGTFGTDDGTQNSVYTAFQRLYNSLLDIMNDDTVPESYLSDIDSASEGVVLSSSGSSATAYSMDSIEPYSDVVIDWSDDAGEETDIQKSVLLDMWSADEGKTIGVGESWTISPDSVEIAESSYLSGSSTGYRESTTYVLHYKLRIPVRFIYSGHSGSALSNPVFMFNLSIQTKTESSYGTPTVYIDSDDISYDRYCNFTTEYDNESVAYLSGTVGYGLFNVPVIDEYSQYSYDLIIDLPVYIVSGSALVFPNAFQYNATVMLESLTYNYDVDFVHVSDQSSEQILEGIAQEQKKQDELENERYEQEQETIQQATGGMTEGVSSVTDTLSTWEIITMPVTIMGDFLEALASSGDTAFTFPSFALMGQTIWPSYTFNLTTVAEHFPLLYNSLHIISGILVVIWFIRYLWRKWAVITGDDLPDGEGK